jgi:hypothetical protein
MKLLARLVAIAAAFGIVGALAPALAYGEVPRRGDLPYLVLAFGVPTAVVAALGAVAWQALPALRRSGTRGQGAAIGVAIALVSQVTAAVVLSL